MKIIDYAASLLKTFSKQTVIGDAKLTREELEDVTAPAYEQAVKVFARRKITNPDLQRLQETFDTIHPHAAENIVMSIEKGMAALIKNIKAIEDTVDKTFNQEIAGVGLTYRKANLLQLLEGYAFVSRYARKILNFAYVAETASLESVANGGKPADAGDEIAIQMLPADIDYLKQQMVYFANVFCVASGIGKHKDIMKAVDDIPDVEVTGSNADVMQATMGKDKVDPFSFGLIPYWLNPVYHIGIIYVEWQNARFRAAEEELRMLQLRKLKLEKRLEDKQDAKLEQQLDYMRKRVNDLEFKLVKMRDEA